jgi:hypothetical protein
MVLQEMAPGSPYHSEVWCNFKFGGRLCKHRRPLDEKQVKYFVGTYPKAEMHDHAYLKALKGFFPREWEEFYGTDLLDK